VLEKSDVPEKIITMSKAKQMKASVSAESTELRTNASSAVDAEAASEALTLSSLV
jgi:hypothetical protein